MKSRQLLRLSLSLLLLCAAPCVAAARVQTPKSSTTGGPIRPETMTTAEPWYDEKNSVQGEIEQVDPKANTVVLRVAKTGMRLVFHLRKGTRLTADKQTELAGRKRLSLSDFKAGHYVKLTVRAADAKPLEMRLRANRS